VSCPINNVAFVRQWPLRVNLGGSPTSISVAVHRRQPKERETGLPGSGPAAAGSNEVYSAPGHITIPEQQISMA